MGAASDADLVQRWRDGDETGREELFSRHYQSIDRFFSVKVPRAAGDLTQQTFLACVELLPRLEKAASFRAFLFGIARNELLRFVRSAGREDRRMQPYETRPGTGDFTPSGIVAHHEVQWLILRALESLPVDLRIALELHYWEAMTSAEIAGVLKVPQSTVTTRLSRARARLAKRVEELRGDGPAVDAAALERHARGLAAIS
ncbi:MAG: RNA polymerase sigma factor [Myxococcota bacterium]